MADVLKKVPVREQDPKVRATNFEEVCYGYNQEEAMEEASRCINCKNAKCIQGCPVGINIPAFVHEVKEGNIEEAYKIIGQSSALPAVCGRVCPQESQCEGKCIRGIKGESISIGKLERFVADYALEHDIKPVGADKKNGHKVAVIGSGPAGLTCAGDLAKLGYDVTGTVMGLLTVPIKLGIVARGLLISGCLALGAYTSAMADMSYFTEANTAELVTLQTGVCVGFMVIPAVCVLVGALLLQFGYKLGKNN